MKNDVIFLDCTVRDGSYVVNFSYKCEEIAGIITELEKAGVPLIEIGHGIGLGAWRRFKKPVCSDRENLNIASNLLTRAKWGMFAIPGICKFEDIEMAGDYGMPFIRIGFEPKKFKQAVPYIEKAKLLNMIVSVNFMKSYTETPNKFAQIAKEAWALGIDYVYLVDSAGGMLPEDIRNYIEELFNTVPDIKIGFHGHNNLGLAVINSLVAIECGAKLIDVSLMGIGRGGGNTYFEQLVAILLKKGYQIDIDLFKLMEISEKYIVKYERNNYTSSIDVISGLALFHSSYMPIVKRVAKEEKVDPKYLIIETSEIEKVDVNYKIVREAAYRLKKKGVYGDWYRFYKAYYGREQ